MITLAIDIGNTFTKIAAFKGNDLLKVVQYQQPAIAHIKDFAGSYPVTGVIISSVKKYKETWEQQLAKSYPVTYFNISMATGINNHYKTPDTLGPDRLAAITGAYFLYPGKANMVINAGTCITYDQISAQGDYFGGSISPGLNMRYKAMNHYTAALPLTEADHSFAAAYGSDTRTAILSGVQNGIRYELEGFINNYTTNQTDHNIVLSGGDSIFFDTLLKNSIFAPCIKIEPYLVLKGLNAAIKKHND